MVFIHLKVRNWENRCFNSFFNLLMFANMFALSAWCFPVSWYIESDNTTDKDSEELLWAHCRNSSWQHHCRFQLKNWALTLGLSLSQNTLSPVKLSATPQVSNSNVTLYPSYFRLFSFITTNLYYSGNTLEQPEYVLRLVWGHKVYCRLSHYPHTWTHKWFLFSSLSTFHTSLLVNNGQ